MRLPIKAENGLFCNLEFQNTNDDEMPYRMASYHALLLQKYKMPIRQVLVYVGKAKYNMQTELPDDQNRQPCKLFNVRELNPGYFFIFTRAGDEYSGDFESF